MKKIGWFTRIMMGIGFVFLYLPLILLVIYSFNESRLVTVWSGFSTKWYSELFQDEQLLAAAWISLKIAVFTAIGSMVLSTVAAVVITRLKHFKGFTLFAFLISTPLVMPEVITGLSLLLLFVGMEQTLGFPEGRGVLTIWIAHVTLTSAYVTVLIASRLQEMDKSIEYAAIDLGARPYRVFFDIVIPMIAPALISGGLLAFTLSLDDLVIASFVSGPGSTTLPMVVYSSVRLGLSPKINALATLFLGVVTIIIVVMTIVVGRRERNRVHS